MESYTLQSDVDHRAIKGEIHTLYGNADEAEITLSFQGKILQKQRIVLPQELPPANILQPNERRMTKKGLFNELYQESLHLKKGEWRERLIAALHPYFKSDQAVKKYVDSNIERKRRNLICRRIRLTRKVNL